jgi:hypothetical protein
MVLHPDAAKKFGNEPSTIPTLVSVLAKGSAVANQMLALRFIANMCRWESVKKLVITHLEEVIA